MKLSPPTFPVFLISLVLTGLAVASLYTPIPIVAGHAFWFAVGGYVLLALGNILRGW